MEELMKMNEYIKFLKKYFPEADMSSFQNEVLFNLICESNIMSDIYI